MGTTHSRVAPEAALLYAVALERGAGRDFYDYLHAYKELQGHARAEFKQWFASAKEFVKDFENALRRNTPVSRKKAAFELHQATERFFAAVLCSTAKVGWSR